MADFLEQAGRRDRRDLLPPGSFWDAAAAHFDPVEANTCAVKAYDRGLYRPAAQLFKNAASAGHANAAINLMALKINQFITADVAQWVARNMSLDDPDSTAHALSMMQSDAPEQTATLLARDPAARTALDNPSDVARLLSEFRRSEAHEQFSALAARSAANIRLDDIDAIGSLLWSLRCTGAHAEIAVIASRSAAYAPIDNAKEAGHLLRSLEKVAARDQIAVLLDRLSARGLDTDPHIVIELVDELIENQEYDRVAVLTRQAVERVPLDNLGFIDALLLRLREKRALSILAHRIATELPVKILDRHAADNIVNILFHMRDFADEATLFASRVATNIDISQSDLWDMQWLIDFLEIVDAEAAPTLAGRIADHAPLGNRPTPDAPRAVFAVWEKIFRIGAHEHAATLATRAATEGVLAASVAVADELRKVGVENQVATLALNTALDAANTARNDPQTAPTDAGTLNNMLKILQYAHEHKAAAILAAHAARHATLDHPIFGSEDPGSLAWLLLRLKDMGHHDNASTLAIRTANAGMFPQFLRYGPNDARQFEFGRTADHQPATPWSWHDLT